MRSRTDEASKANGRTSSRPAAVNFNLSSAENAQASSPHYRIRLVVISRARDLLALGVGHRACDRARFSVFGHDDRAVTDGFAILLAHHVDLVFAVQLERASIGLGIASHWIIFAVEFPGPDGVSFFTISVSSVDRAFLLFANFFPHHQRGFTGAVAEGGFAFVQFPRAQGWVARETHCGGCD